MCFSMVIEEMGLEEVFQFLEDVPGRFLEKYMYGKLNRSLNVPEIPEEPVMMPGDIPMVLEVCKRDSLCSRGP